MKRHSLATIRKRGAALLLAVCCLIAMSVAAEETVYVENEWNYVDGSMNVSGGIPENAGGVLGMIRERGVLRVATEPYFAPQEFIDPDLDGQDTYAGADMEFARLLAERMGVELLIVPMDFTKVLQAVASDECDLAISALSFTPDRASMVELSKGYYFSESDAACGMLIRESDKDRIKSIEDLGNKILIAQRGSLQEALTAENVREYREFRRVSFIQDVYQALEDGKADAATVDVNTAMIYIHNHPDSHLMLVPDIAFNPGHQFQGDRIAAKKGELQLLYFVNGVIDEVLENGQYQAWYDQYEDYASQIE
jgi:polar amino acid transport system substrate-binding protein